MKKRVAIVTGAGGGIGRAVSRRLLDRGFDVIGIGRAAPKMDGDVLGGGKDKWHPMAADVRSAKALGEALKNTGAIHAVVVNAGVCRRAHLDDAAADEVWREVLDINLTGAWNTLRAVHDRLAPGAAAVMVSSGLGKVGRPGYGAYTASKHGMLGLVKCLSPELASRGIRINAVCPGWVDTEMARADLRVTAAEQGIDIEEARRDAEQGIPLGRFVKPGEVADLICWLLSDEASAVTGQAYNITCGELAV
jgi:3-hydroxybutyrate dehydrogenase